MGSFSPAQIDEKGGSATGQGSAAEARLQSLVRVSSLLSTTLLQEDVLDLVLTEAMQQMSACGGQIDLRSGNQGRFRNHLSRGQVVGTPELDRKVIARRQPLVAQEYLSDVRSALVVPILFEGDVAGLIRLFRDLPEVFSSADVTYTTALANHSAVAIGNARRFSELKERNTLLQRRTQQIEHFLESSRIFHSERRMEEVYEELVYAIQEGVGFNVVLLSLVEQGPEPLLRRVTAAGLPLDRLQELKERRQPWHHIEQLLQPVYRLGGAYFVPAGEAAVLREQLDIHQVADLYPSFGETRDRAGEKQGAWHQDDLFFIPLRDSRGMPLGLISLTAPLDGRRPDLNTARVLEVFANQAAGAIENVQLFHNMWDYALQLQQLHNVSQQTLREPDFDKKLKYILDGLDVAGWDRVTLTLRDEAFEVTKLVTAGFSQEERHNLRANLLPADKWRARFSDEFLQRYRRGNCFLIPDDEPWSPSLDTAAAARELPEPIDHVAGGAWQEGSVLYRPLYDHNESLVGLLGLAEPRNGRHPDENGLQTIDLYAQFAISVIENYRLFREMQQRSQELQTLFDASRELSQALEQKAILSAMGEHMVQAVKADAYAVYSLRRDKAQTVVVRSDSPISQIDEAQPASPYGLQQLALAMKVVESGQPLTERIDVGAGEDGDTAYSVAMFPLSLSEEPFGLVQIVAMDEQFRWSEEKLQLLGAIVNQASTALETAHLIEELDERVAERTRALAEEVAKIQSILESIGDGVLVTGSDGTVIMANLPTARILDTPRYLLIGRPVYDLTGVYGEAADRWFQTIREWAEQEEEPERQASLLDQIDIEDTTISVHVSPVFANDRYFGSVSILRDITKEVEVDRMKSEFVSTVSHELRTPMTSIKGYVDLLLMGAAGEVSHSQLHYLDVIKRNAERLKILVDDLLDISRIETGRTALKIQPVNVHQLVEDTMSELVRGRLEQVDKEIQVMTDLAPSLPLVSGDPEKVTRVLTNLVDNAINYTPEGGEVQISARADDSFVRISVRDTGIGISKVEQERIFDRFYRSEDEKVQAVPGTGLGLAIVRSLVEMHGGHLDLESEPGMGSTFTFSLPIVEQDSTP